MPMGRRQSATVCLLLERDVNPEDDANSLGAEGKQIHRHCCMHLWGSRC